MSDNFLHRITLPAAKPYEGKAQTAAVGAVVRRMIDAGWVVAPSRYPNGMGQLQVRGRGSRMVDGELVSVAEINFLPGERGATLEQIAARLREAGWDVSDVKKALGVWSSVDIAGPGVAEWAAGMKAAKAVQAERKAAADAARLSSAEALKALAVKHGVVALIGHVSEFSDSVHVPYSRMIELIETLTGDR